MNQLLLACLLLASAGFAAQASPFTPTQTNTTTPTSIKVSWGHIPGYNPFSTSDIYYEVWHNGNFYTAIDENSIIIPLISNPQLASGCFQIRAVSGTKKSELSFKSCYSS